MIKRWIRMRRGMPARALGLGLLLLLTAAGRPGTAQAAERGYGASGAGGGGAAAEEDEAFSQAVDLKRFRNKNFEWDTQELIASGFNALHDENRKILKELREIKERIARLEEKQTP